MTRDTFTGYRGTDLPQQLAAAQPLARQIVMLGIGDLDGLPGSANEQLHIRVKQLTGYDTPPCADTDMPIWMERERAAYVLGIAVGLLLRPDLFDGGGQ